MGSVDAAASKARLVLVEDDADITALVQSVAGDGIHVFADGPSAIEHLTSTGNLPQLVLLDLDLPGMHGLEVLKRLRHDNRTKRVPVVIFTATDLSPEEGYRLGANAWVRKASDADGLEAALRSILDFWTGLNQPAGLATA